MTRVSLLCLFPIKYMKYVKCNAFNEIRDTYFIFHVKTRENSGNTVFHSLDPWIVHFTSKDDQEWRSQKQHIPWNMPVFTAFNMKCSDSSISCIMCHELHKYTRLCVFMCNRSHY